jgi:hypothetical protein
VRETAGFAISPISSSPRADAVVASTVFKATLHPQHPQHLSGGHVLLPSPLGGRPRFALSKRRRKAVVSQTRQSTPITSWLNSRAARGGQTSRATTT